MSKVRPDQFPNYPQAGLKKTVQNQSSAVCLQPPQRNVQTPQQIQRYRKSFKQQPGVTIKHFGLANDPLPQQTFTYGVPTQKSEGVGNVLKAGGKQGVNQYVNNLMESKYKSLKQQPLGSTINRNYNMPDVAKQQQFKFGLATQKNQFDVKETIYSGVNLLEQQKTRLMYLKSHGDYDAGQQKNRQYNWNVDPTDFRFGKVQKNIVHGQIKQIMAPQSFTDKFPQTKFVKSNLNDFMDKKDDKLGKPANLGQKQFPPDKVFGVRVQPNQWNAGKCLKGEATQYQVRPDDDLGHSTRFGFRNIVKEGDDNRVFGVPTIRYDIKKPQRQSVADPNNYADQTTAVQLLFPQSFASFGVDDKDFKMPRPKKQIKQIFENIGFVFKGHIFDAIFERAKAIQGTILQKVSCLSFKKSLMEMSS